MVSCSADTHQHMMHVVDALSASRVPFLEDATTADISWSVRHLEDMWCNHEHGGEPAVCTSDDGQ